MSLVNMPKPKVLESVEISRPLNVNPHPREMRSIVQKPELKSDNPLSFGLLICDLFASLFLSVCSFREHSG